MPRTREYTNEAIAQALRDNDGIQYYAAEQLGCDPSLVCLRVKESPELQELVEDGLRKMDGKADRVIHKALESDDEKISADMGKWIKARLSRDRFSDRKEITGADGAPLDVVLKWPEDAEDE